GIQPVKKKAAPPVPAADKGKEPEAKGPPPAAPARSAGEKPDLVIWHWSDERLQSEQQKTGAADKNHSDLWVYRVADKKFLRLADATLRNVTVAPRQRWAYGTDRRPYELDGTLDGRRFHDLYVIDLQTGERKQALKKLRWQFAASPDGTHLLYYED